MSTVPKRLLTELDLPSIDCRLTVAEIYARIEFSGDAPTLWPAAG